MLNNLSKLFSTAILIFGIVVSGSAAAEYQDAVELQKKCEANGNLAASVFKNKKKVPNYFKALQNAPAWQQPFLDLDRKDEAAQTMRDIYLAVYITESFQSSKEAYMYGWSTCMDHKFEDS